MHLMSRRLPMENFQQCFYKLDHPHVFFYLQSLLRIISKDHRIPNIYFAAVRLFQTLYNIDER